MMFLSSVVRCLMWLCENVVKLGFMYDRFGVDFL